VDYAGEPTTSIAQRRNNCITVSSWQAGTLATCSVIVENVGDAAASVTVEFFLSVPTGQPPTQLSPGLCKPANPLPPTGLQPLTSTSFSLQYPVQGTDVGADTLYAQIQAGPGPFPDPSDMTQSCNASKTVDILGAPGGPGPSPGGPGHGGPGHGGHGHGGEGHQPDKKPQRTR